MVKIRLARGGRTHKPVYTIVAANSREARDGKFLEKLGQYDPNAKEVLKDVNVDSIKSWVTKGAQITDTVASLFKKNGVKL
ncbi:MAG: 30S ribosomal protein S16 [Bacteriovoracaceae bacterium]|nr:30S ribosomal protein S16 [Bacteriovoracaceae bacterium]